jgi:uridine kinase
LAAAAERTSSAADPEPFLICLDGPSGAGKTTLAQILAAETGACVVHMDDLYGGWDGLDRAWPRLEAWVLEPLRAGCTARFRAFDWRADTFAGPLQRIRPGRIVLAEGCGSAPRAADGVARLIVWVDAPAPIRWERTRRRDGSSAEASLRAWAAAEAEHFAREQTQSRSDVTVQTA